MKTNANEFTNRETFKKYAQFVAVRFVAMSEWLERVKGLAQEKDGKILNARFTHYIKEAQAKRDHARTETTRDRWSREIERLKENRRNYLKLLKTI